MRNTSLAPLNIQYTKAKDQSKREKAKRTELIISDGLCPQISQLLEEALHEHIPLGRCKDPLENIATALEERRSRGGAIETLHIVAHGKPGKISIGGINIEKKDIKKHVATVKEWRVNEIALWCCESAVDEDFIRELLLHSKAKRVWGSTQKLGNRKQPDLNEFNQTDQFPRNSARREPKAFEKDTWASFDHALALSAEDISVSQAAGYAVFSITGGDSNGYINLQLKDGSATGNGADYGASSGSQLEVSTDGGSNWSQYSTQ